MRNPRNSYPLHGVEAEAGPFGKMKEREQGTKRVIGDE